MDIALPINGEYHHVRLDFAARTSGDKFELCEVEMWGKHAK